LSKNKSKNKKIYPKTAQKTVPINSAFDDGIIESQKGEFSKSFEFIDINYHAIREEEKIDTFAKYCEFLNFFNFYITFCVILFFEQLD